MAAFVRSVPRCRTIPGGASPDSRRRSAHGVGLESIIDPRGGRWPPPAVRPPAGIFQAGGRRPAHSFSLRSISFPFPPTNHEEFPSYATDSYLPSTLEFGSWNYLTPTADPLRIRISCVIAWLHGLRPKRQLSQRKSDPQRQISRWQRDLGSARTRRARKKRIEAPIGPDGTYFIGDPPKGTVKIAVKGIPGAAPQALPRDPSLGRKKASATCPPSKILDMGVAPPAKYASPETSGLTYTVKGGKETFDIPLTP